MREWPITNGKKGGQQTNTNNGDNQWPFNKSRPISAENNNAANNTKKNFTKLNEIKLTDKVETVISDILRNQVFLHFIIIL